MAVEPSASYSLTVRLEIKNRPGTLGRVASAIGQAGADIGAVDLVQSSRDRIEIRNKVPIRTRDDVARAAHATGVARRGRRRAAAAVS